MPSAKSLLREVVEEWAEDHYYQRGEDRIDISTASEAEFQSHVMSQLNNRYQRDCRNHWTRLTNISSAQRVSASNYDDPYWLQDYIRHHVGEYFIVSRNGQRIDSLAIKRRSGWVWLNRPRNALALERKFDSLPRDIGRCTSCGAFGPVVIADLDWENCGCECPECEECYPRYCSNCVSENWAVRGWGA